MPFATVVCQWLALLSLLPPAGCYSYRKVTVTVRDAETGQPIPGAAVYTTYNEGLAHVAPSTSRGITGRDGSTRIRVAKDPQGIFIIPEAKGYLDYWAGGIFPDGRPYSAPHTELPRWPFAAVALTLYAEPAPEVVLIVPDGYRGLIPLQDGYGRRGNPWPGRRVFEVTWKPGRVAPLRDLPQITGIPPVVQRVRYAGGDDVPRGARDSPGIGWWWAGSAGREYQPGMTYILIGTVEDRIALTPKLPRRPVVRRASTPPPPATAPAHPAVQPRLEQPTDDTTH